MREQMQAGPNVQVRQAVFVAKIILKNPQRLALMREAGRLVGIGFRLSGRQSQNGPVDHARSR